METAIMDLNTTIMSDLQLHTLGVGVTGIILPLSNLDPFIAEICAKVNADLGEHNKSLSRETVDPDTARLKDANKKREKAFNYLRDKVRVELDSHEAILSDAAHQIWDIFTKHGTNLRGLTYTERSTRIDAIMMELSAVVNTPLIASLGVNSAVENLRATETAFDTIVKERAGKAGEKHSVLLKTESVGILRRDLHSLVYNFDYKYAKSTDQDYIRAIAAINSLISNEVAIARMRKTDAAKAAEKKKPAASVQQ